MILQKLGFGNVHSFTNPAMSLPWRPDRKNHKQSFLEANNLHSIPTVYLPHVQNNISQPFSHGGPPRSILFTFSRILTYENENKTHRHLEAHGHYSSGANWESKMSLDISRGIWKCLWFVNMFIFPKISSGNSKDVTRNPNWETLVENIKWTPTNILFNCMWYFRNCISPSAYRWSHCPKFSNRIQAVLTSDLWRTLTPSINCGLCPRYRVHCRTKAEY
jgi:hypothetical protein